MVAERFPPHKGRMESMRECRAVVIVNFLIKFSQRREPRNDFFIIQFRATEK